MSKEKANTLADKLDNMFYNAKGWLDDNAASQEELNELEQDYDQLLKAIAVLEIIKEREFLLKGLRGGITQEEFDLLKEVLL